MQESREGCLPEQSVASLLDSFPLMKCSKILTAPPDIAATGPIIFYAIFEYEACSCRPQVRLKIVRSPVKEAAVRNEGTAGEERQRDKRGMVCCRSRESVRGKGSHNIGFRLLQNVSAWMFVDPMYVCVNLHFVGLQGSKNSLKILYCKHAL